MQNGEQRREELQGYVANSRRVRRTAIWLGAAASVLGFALRIAGVLPSVSLAVLVVGVVIAGAGAWITTAHIQDFEKELR